MHRESITHRAVWNWAMAWVSSDEMYTLPSSFVHALLEIGHVIQRLPSIIACWRRVSSTPFSREIGFPRYPWIGLH